MGYEIVGLIAGWLTMLMVLDRITKAMQVGGLSGVESWMAMSLWSLGLLIAVGATIRIAGGW